MSLHFDCDRFSSPHTTDSPCERSTEGKQGFIEVSRSVLLHFDVTSSRGTGPLVRGTSAVHHPLLIAAWMDFHPLLRGDPH